jgi:hypothetical protein
MCIRPPAVVRTGKTAPAGLFGLRCIKEKYANDCSQNFLLCEVLKAVNVQLSSGI